MSTIAQTERIDFITNSNGTVTVTKFRKKDDSPFDIQFEGEIKSAEFDFDHALSWCRENGFHVITWPGGARAVKGDKPKIIRTARQIYTLRIRLEKELAYLRKTQRNPERQAQLFRLTQLDLAYYG